MTDNSGVGQIDINVSADQAEATLKRLIQLAEQADQTFQQLQRDAVEAVNAAKIPLGGGGYHNVTVSHADQARGFAQGGGADLVPGLTTKIADMDNRQRAIAAQVGQFVATQTPALATSSPTQLFGQYGAWRGQQPPLAGGSSSAGTGPSAPPLSAVAPTGANAAATQQKPASKQTQAAAPGAGTGATGSAAAPTGANAAVNQQQAGSPAQSFGQAAATQFGNALRQLGVGGAGSAGALGNRVVQVGLARVANAAGIGGMGAGGLLRAGAEALGPVGIGALALGAAAIAANNQQAAFNAQAQALAAAEPGNAFASFTAREGLLSAGTQASAFNFDPNHASGEAATLAQKGVQPNQIPSALANSYGFTRMLGSDDPTAVTGLTGSLMAGGASASQVNQTFQQLIGNAQASGVSLVRLVDALSAVQKSAAGARVNVAGLAAAQHLLSSVAPGANVGQVLGGVLGSTGGQAIAQASLLGLGSDKALADLQQHPDQVTDRISTLVKRLDKGTYGPEVTEGVLQSSGLADLSGMNPAQQRAYIETLRTATPGSTAALATQYGVQTGKGLTTQDQSLATWAQATAANTSAMDRLGVFIQNGIFQSVNNAGGQPALTGPAASQRSALQLSFPAVAARFAAGTATPNDLTAIKKRYPAYYVAQEAYVQQKGGTPGPGTPSPGTPGPGTPGGYSPTGDAGSAAVPVYRGGSYQETDRVGNPLMGMYVAAARANNTPGLLKAALAVSAMESGFKPGAIQQGGNGRGIAQFDLSLNQAGGETGSNLANAAHYLHTSLTGHTAADVAAAQTAALNPAIAIPAQAAMLSDLYHSHHNNWQEALSAYNGSGPAAAQYGQDVSSSISGVTVIDIKGTLYDTNGNPVGTVHPTKTQVNTARKSTGYATHGPTK